MKRTKILVLVGALILLVVLGVYAGGTAESYPTPDKPLILKGGHVLPPGSTQDRTCNAWADLVEERTKGAVIIEVFPAEQLGNEKILTENVNLGTIDWTFIGPGSLARFTPHFGMFENAYTFESTKHLENSAFNREFIEYLSGVLEAKSNVKFLGFQWYGHRNALADKPILTPQDGQGMRIRVPDVPSYRVAAHAMGATATPIPFGETYMAMKQGVVDACEGNNENLFNMKFYEVKKVVTLTRHIEAITCIVMNRNGFAKLSPDQQRIVLDSGYETWKNFFSGYMKTDREFRQKLEAQGVRFVDLTDQQFGVFRSRAIDKLKDEHIPQWGQTWEKFNALAK